MELAGNFSAWVSAMVCRVGIRNCCPMCATVTATQRIMSRYFPSLNILFRSAASALNELAVRVGLRADDCNKLVGLVVGASRMELFLMRGSLAGKKMNLGATNPAAEEALYYGQERRAFCQSSDAVVL